MMPEHPAHLKIKYASIVPQQFRKDMMC